MHPNPMFLLPSLLLLALACATPATVSDRDEADAPASGWAAVLRTSGGITGRGLGDVSVQSDRTVIVTDRKQPCRTVLTDEEFRTLAGQIAAARPAGWQQSYVRSENPEGAADQIRYALGLSVQRNGKLETFDTWWYDETAALLPPDLRAIADTLAAVRTRAVRDCG